MASLYKFGMYRFALLQRLAFVGPHASISIILLLVAPTRPPSWREIAEHIALQ